MHDNQQLQNCIDNTIAISLRSQMRVASHIQETQKLSTYMMEDVADALRQKSQICSIALQVFAMKFMFWSMFDNRKPFHSMYDW